MTYHKINTISISHYALELVMAMMLILLVSTAPVIAQSTDRKNATPLISSELRGELSGGDEEYFYSFMMRPGDLMLTFDVKASGTNAGATLDLFDANSTPIISNLLAQGINRGSERVVLKAHFAKQQKVTMGIKGIRYGSSGGQGAYQVRLDGPVDFGQPNPYPGTYGAGNTPPTGSSVSYPGDPYPGTYGTGSTPPTSSSGPYPTYPGTYGTGNTPPTGSTVPYPAGPYPGTYGTGSTPSTASTGPSKTDPFVGLSMENGRPRLNLQMDLLNLIFKKPSLKNSNEITGELQGGAKEYYIAVRQGEVTIILDVNVSGNKAGASLDLLDTSNRLILTNVVALGENRGGAQAMKRVRFDKPQLVIMRIKGMQDDSSGRGIYRVRLEGAAVIDPATLPAMPGAQTTR